jgi:NDP-sugar pyrophosphorylase family protein
MERRITAVTLANPCPHILKYAHFGIEESYVALSYLGDQIKRWFVDRQTLADSDRRSIWWTGVRRKQGRLP